MVGKPHRRAEHASSTAVDPQQETLNPVAFTLDEYCSMTSKALMALAIVSRDGEFSGVDQKEIQKILEKMFSSVRQLVEVVLAIVFASVHDKKRQQTIKDFLYSSLGFQPDKQKKKKK